jgi:hypothetical protein
MKAGFIVRKNIGCVTQLVFSHPFVLRTREAFPFNIIRSLRRGSTVCDDHFNLLFFFAINDIGWWHNKIRTMGFIFFIGRKEGSVEDRVNSLL